MLSILSIVLPLSGITAPANGIKVNTCLNFFCSKVKDELQTFSAKLNKCTFIIRSSDHYISFVRNSLLAQCLLEDSVFSRHSRRSYPGMYTYDSVSFCDNEPTRAERQSVKLGCELIWVVERGGLRALAGGREARGDRDTASCALPNRLATTSSTFKTWWTHQFYISVLILQYIKEFKHYDIDKTYTQRRLTQLNIYLLFGNRFQSTRPFSGLCFYTKSIYNW